MQCRICQSEFDAEGGKDVCPDCAQRLTSALGSSDLLNKAMSRMEAQPERSAALGPKGRQRWKSQGSDAIQVAWPLSVALHPSREILVLDQPDEYRILRFDREGKVLGVLLEIACGPEDGGVEDPQGLAVDRAGKLYVPDAGNDRIAIWNENAEFSHFVGGSGNGPGEFAHPRDVDIDADGFVYVADTFNRRIQKLSPDGLVSVLTEKLGDWGAFAEPVAITSDPQGNIYVADAELNRVFLLNAEGELQRMLPDHKSEPTLFEKPGDVRLLSNGHMLVSDRSNLRIQRFDAQWQPAGVIDISQSDDNLADGGDIAAYDNRVLIPDRFNDCVYCMEFEDAGKRTAP